MAIHTEGLTKRYGDVAALHHLDLDVGPGEVVGFLGPNGAGKTNIGNDISFSLSLQETLRTRTKLPHHGAAIQRHEVRKASPR
jgi:ABC-type uncharacterized transport system ATPase subunit